MPIVQNIVTSSYEVIGDYRWQTLDNNQSESVFYVYGYNYSKLRAFVFHLICILFGGLPYFALSYYPIYNKHKYSNVGLTKAEYVGITDRKKVFEIQKVHELELNLSNQLYNKLRYFMYQHSRHIWNADQGVYIHILSLNKKIPISLLMENTSGLNKRQQNEMIKLYGLNSIAVEVKSYTTIFFHEVFNPFYVFQAFSIILWSLDEYYQYATCVLFLSIVSCLVALHQTKQMSRKLHALAGSNTVSTVTVLRPTRTGREECVVSAKKLVPGDVLVLPPDGCMMPCDAMLVTGTCIVNESMLTGESVPVMKGPPEGSSSEVYSTETHKRHTLFSGTHVIQTRFYGNNQVLAKVVRTGFSTSKGELIKSILYPTSQTFKFYSDAVKFVGFMFLIAAMGMVYSIWLYVLRGSSKITIILRTLDIITIVVPPALPAAMTAGIVQSQKRLREKKIFCVSPPRIVVCGKLQVMCFDKTGTLTEDGLDFYGVIPTRQGEKFGERIDSVNALPSTSPLVQALASCHSLTSIQGELKGDPLDLKMFEFTQWILEEPGPENTRYDTLTPAIVKPVTTQDVENDDNYDPYTMEVPYEVGLIRRFHFSSAQQSMGVIARVLGQPQMLYFVKGAPEKVAGMCDPTTLPENFSSVLNDYTWNGYRVISLAYKKLGRKMKWADAQRVQREALECDMIFLGFLVMQNSLKPETTQIIKELHEANIKQIMVTGDNLMTAMSVARGCYMVQPHQKIVLVTVGQGSDEEKPPVYMEVVGEGGPPKVGMDFVYAMDGKTWSMMKVKHPDMLDSIVQKGVVYGRFGPDQKTQLIVALQNHGWVVGMCGDGANDCGALKAAHVGISLSEADASVAAPFTSQEQNITCVKLLVLEGRCALSTSFAIFKYMALYSIIQFFSILILYKFFSILGNNQFLYIDLVLTTLLALSLGRASPGPTLTKQSPPVSLVSPTSIIPLIIQVVQVLVVQLLSVYLLQSQGWFIPVKGGPDVEQVNCWENTVVFIISSFQYLIMACVYAKGWPFRQPFCSNYAMVVTLLTQVTFVLLLLYCPWQWLVDYMELQPMLPEQYQENMFRVYLILIPVIHFMIAVSVEAVFSDPDKLDSLYKFFKRRCTDKDESTGEDVALLCPPPSHIQIC